MQTDAVALDYARAYVAFDPREWSNQYDVDINVGLGAGNRQEQMAMLQMLN